MNFEYKTKTYSLAALIAIILCIIPVVFIIKKRENEIKPLVVDSVAIQALKVCPPCEQEKPKREIPTYTKFKASDWVCAWGKWSGVIVRVEWSELNPNLLIYKVQHLASDGSNWTYDDYFDTELTLGKCD